MQIFPALADDFEKTVKSREEAIAWFERNTSALTKVERTELYNLLLPRTSTWSWSIPDLCTILFGWNWHAGLCWIPGNYGPAPPPSPPIPYTCCKEDGAADDAGGVPMPDAGDMPMPDAGGVPMPNDGGSGG